MTNKNNKVKFIFDRILYSVDKKDFYKVYSFTNFGNRRFVGVTKEEVIIAKNIPLYDRPPLPFTFKYINTSEQITEHNPEI